VATPPVELATRTKILQLDGLASTAAPAAISSPGFLGAIVAQEGRHVTPKVGFVSAFMTNKIKLDKGSPPKVIALAPKSGAVVGSFYKIDTEWPDDMSP